MPRKIYNLIKNSSILKSVLNIISNAFDKLLIIPDNLILVPTFLLINRYLFSRINFHYGASYRMGNYKSQNLDSDTKNFGYGYIHYALIRNIKPSKVLCIGSMYGYIPFVCALACKDNKKGSVDFVDAAYDINNPNDTGRHNWGQGFWKKVSPPKHFSYLGTRKFIKTFVQTTKDFASANKKRKYDYIYIDGDHSYKGVKTDYKLFWPMLKSGGIMAFHDTDNDGVHGDIYYDVTKFCKEAIYPNKRYFHFPNPESGLVILQK